MKKIFMLISLFLFFAISLITVNAQVYKENDTLFVDFKTYMRLDNYNSIRNSITLDVKTKVILKIEKDFDGWYLVYVPSIDTIGYIHNAHLKNKNEFNSKTFIFKSIKNNDPFQIIKNKYGYPDDIQKFSSGNYQSITYIYYCSYGKYRSFDFEKNNGKWVLESKHESTGICY